MHMEMDDAVQAVRCLDCGGIVEAYWALRSILSEIQAARASIERARAEIEEGRRATLHLIAAKRVEKLWRGRRMAPVCPHCRRGILPEDGLGTQAIQREMEVRIREVNRAREQKTS